MNGASKASVISCRRSGLSDWNFSRIDLRWLMTVPRIPLTVPTSTESLFFLEAFLFRSRIICVLWQSGSQEYGSEVDAIAVEVVDAIAVEVEAVDAIAVEAVDAIVFWPLG